MYFGAELKEKLLQKRDDFTHLFLFMSALKSISLEMVDNSNKNIFTETLTVNKIKKKKI
jgi:hypothetical protein